MIEKIRSYFRTFTSLSREGEGEGDCPVLSLRGVDLSIVAGPVVPFR